MKKGHWHGYRLTLGNNIIKQPKND